MKARFMRVGMYLAASAAAFLMMAGAPGTAGPKVRPDLDPANLTGKLLVASPQMNDPNFAKTVVFMLEHNEHGALGIVINHELGAAPAADVLKGLGLESDGAAGQIKVFLGGPVEPQVAIVLHSTDYSNGATHNITPGVSVTGNSAVLEAISHGSGPKKSLLALGYSGWGPGQLESEMAHDAWYVAPADPNVIFGDDIAGKWKQALAISGTDL